LKNLVTHHFQNNERPILTDSFGRRITYLRIAMTDRCNLRCIYCMPAEGILSIPRQEILKFEEVARLIKIFAELGITKLRFTGGEPFVRKGFVDFLQQIDSQNWVEAIHITTNGVLVANYLAEISKMRLKGINLSLDSLHAERFAQITRRNDFAKVQAALNGLLTLGISTKINCVVQKGINTDEIINFVKLSQKNPLEVRFIEQMAFNGTNQSVETFSASEILSVIKWQFPDLQQITEENGTAVKYKIDGFQGTIGIIAANSRSFCGSCHRVRVTSTGQLKPCLYGKKSLDLRALMRNGANDTEIKESIKLSLWHKKANGFEAEREIAHEQKESMALIGG